MSKSAKLLEKKSALDEYASIFNSIEYNIKYYTDRIAQLETDTSDETARDIITEYKYRIAACNAAIAAIEKLL